jgi:hypothetical protein
MVVVFGGWVPAAFRRERSEWRNAAASVGTGRMVWRGGAADRRQESERMEPGGGADRLRWELGGRVGVLTGEEGVGVART